MNVIVAEGLTKSYRVSVKEPGLKGAIKHLFNPRYQERVAVNGINLTIKEGEAVAYVGPNGAGKSTTIKMLTGILVPTSGKVLVNGAVPSKNRMDNASRIGVVFGQRTQLWWDLPIIESFELIKDIYEVPTSTYKKNMEQFVELLGLEEFLHVPARRISLGQRMRADLAAALLHNPKIVYLDEPTIGLDIAVKERIRAFIKEMNQQHGTTIMLTTHDLEDIEEICSRLVIIDKGSVIYDGDLQTVKNVYARERTIHFQLERPIVSLPSLIESMPSTSLVREEGLRFSLRFDKYEISASEIARHMMNQGEVMDFHIDEPKIDHVIRKVYNHDLNLQEAWKEAEAVAKKEVRHTR
ncbi:ABC transporter ATP-binding protein [Paenibacillus sp. 1001270B_150601_E10]|uniref:ABC transporter ATP-binding protein n=1 Tax=Paenibacillus sp. 1001270B_150601_E10 TaxID=2787079 RepID=UPI00189F6C06|nr:ATP-binding cassette domain-containing protein [Paenibacillus sp. 1001270B_150601_E10]